MNDAVWLTWEDHRRSRELAGQFKADYHPITMTAGRWIRYPVLAFTTLKFLYRRKPKYVFCQNPSIVLTALVCLLQPLLGYGLVVDRHSNFKLETINSSNLKWRVFHLLSRWTVKHADLTIVTNDHLKNLCEKWHGRAVILQDKVPSIADPVFTRFPNFFRSDAISHVMCITKFDPDEPVHELIKASRALPNIAFYMTGNYRKRFSEPERAAASEHNTVFTGFIEEKAFAWLLHKSDFVVVLTTKDYILNCGAYEAVGARKPLLLSDTKTLRSYFGNGIVYVNPRDPEAIKLGVEELINNEGKYVPLICKKREQLDKDWDLKFTSVLEAIDCYVPEHQ